ncbi:MAG TPA: 2OG-Fe(II) oxygenase [Stellaceae bacterium]|nr:2OG-Fe(II) oxygenase [Stellaceae bacterium]
MLPSEAAWPDLLAALDARGHAVLPAVLDAAECRVLAALYDERDAFRSRVVMARHNFGSGEYKYLRYPLPPLVATLRDALYARLAPLADAWHARLRLEPRFPPRLSDYLALCHAAGQQRPTPLILKYEAGDYNCLHQDLYGEFVFPLQATLLLSAPEHDFAGGEFLLVEGRPRMQSRGTVVPLAQGDAVVFAVNHRPVAGTRGFYRATMRHGVSPLRSGRRFTLGIIFHDSA